MRTDAEVTRAAEQTAKTVLRLIGERDEARAERDRARAVAVALEGQVAAVEALNDKVAAFLAKYPDDAELEWQKPRPKRAALDTMVADLVEAGERHKRTTDHVPHAEQTGDQLRAALGVEP